MATRPKGATAVRCLLLLALTAAACSGPAPTPAVSPSGPSAAGSTASSPAISGSTLSPADAALAYGYPATRDASLVYQPDVVFVGGGPSIVRWESADGLTWAVDRNAPGAADLKVDSVMYATSRVVGRVAQIKDDGDSRIVTLAPIDLTELISDGTVEMDQPFDLGSAVYQQFANPVSSWPTPDASASPSAGALDPWASASASSGTASVGAAQEAVYQVQPPPIRFLLAASGSGGSSGATMPPPVKICPEVTVQGWGVKPCLEPGKLSLQLSAPALASRLKFTGTVTIRATHLSVKAKFTVAGGSISDSTAVLDGIEGIGVSVAAGTADPAKGNTKFRMELPIEACGPAGALIAVPLIGCTEFKVLIEVAFSGKNSTLSAGGAYGLTGPVGIEAGKAVIPSLVVQQSLMDSISGIVLGPSGIVLAGRIKFQVGIGAPGMMAGPYVAVTTSYGVAKGSVLGSPIATCRTAALDVSMAAGLGLQIDVAKVLPLLPSSFADRFQGLRALKAKVESEVSASVFSRKQTLPDPKLCGS